MPPARSLLPYAGNAYDKYGSHNPLARMLTRRFLQSIDELVSESNPSSILDVGCGEGFITQRWASMGGVREIVGLDRGELHAHWRRHEHDNLRFQQGDARALPFADRSFDLVSGIELLEQVSEPHLALAEMLRVARSGVLVSVPREPVWRVLNMLRGSYLRWLGNPPGHVNHWSHRAFRAFVAEQSVLDAVRSPFPWTVILARVQ